MSIPQTLLILSALSASIQFDTELLLGFDAARKGDHAKAVERFHRAIAIGEEEWRPYDALGALYYCLGEYTAARIHYSLARDKAINRATRDTMERYVLELNGDSRSRTLLQKTVDCDSVPPLGDGERESGAG